MASSKNQDILWMEKSSKSFETDEINPLASRHNDLEVLNLMVFSKGFCYINLIILIFAFILAAFCSKLFNQISFCISKSLHCLVSIHYFKQADELFNEHVREKFEFYL